MLHLKILSFVNACVMNLFLNTNKSAQELTRRDRKNCSLTLYRLGIEPSVFGFELRRSKHYLPRSRQLSEIRRLNYCGRVHILIVISSVGWIRKIPVFRHMLVSAKHSPAKKREKPASGTW